MSKTGIIFIGGVVLAVIAYQVLERVPSDALNVGLGVACGIAASIPVSLGLLIALTRQRRQTEQQAEWADPEPVQIIQPPTPRPIPQPAQFTPQSPQLQQPQIIVVTPQGQIIGGQGQYSPGQFSQPAPVGTQWNPQQYPFMHEQPNAIDAREWRIIGQE